MTFVPAPVPQQQNLLIPPSGSFQMNGNAFDLNKNPIDISTWGIAVVIQNDFSSLEPGQWLIAQSVNIDHQYLYPESAWALQFDQVDALDTGWWSISKSSTGLYKVLLFRPSDTTTWTAKYGSYSQLTPVH